MDDAQWPLMLHPNQARKAGATEADIDRAKKSPQPVPKHWPVPQVSWMIYPKLQER